MQLIKKISIFSILSFVPLIQDKIFAYPVIIGASDVSNLQGVNRNNLIAIAPDGQGSWKKIPLQIEEVEDEAAIVFRAPTKILPLRAEHPHPGTVDPFEGKLDTVHRLILEDDTFGVCTDKCQTELQQQAKMLCNNQNNVSIFPATRIDLNFLKKTAFVVNCKSKQQSDFKSTVAVDLEKRIFKATEFSYAYRSKKDILLDKITFQPDNIEVLGPSELQVYLKPKYLVNMHFEDKDLISRVTSVTQGSVGAGVEVAFSLKVLGFKVNSQICCDVSVFKDSLYFPVMLDLPFEGSSFQKGSGLFYGLNYGGDIDKDIKIYAPKLGETKQEDSTNPGSTLMIRTQGKVMAVAFRNAKKGISDSIAPSLAMPEDLKTLGFPKVKTKFGLFYDVTTLKKGFHNFNVWFYVGKESNADQLLEYGKYGIRFKTTPVR